MSETLNKVFDFVFLKCVFSTTWNTPMWVVDTFQISIIYNLLKPCSSDC